MRRRYNALDVDWLVKTQVFPISNKPKVSDVPTSRFFDGWIRNEAYRLGSFFEDRRRLGLKIKELKQQVDGVGQLPTQYFLQQTMDTTPSLAKQQRLMAYMNKEQGRANRLLAQTVHMLKSRIVKAKEKRRIPAVPGLLAKRDLIKAGVSVASAKLKVNDKHLRRKIFLKLKKVLRRVVSLGEFSKNLNKLINSSELAVTSREGTEAMTKEWNHFNKEYTKLQKVWKKAYRDLLQSDIFFSLDEHENNLDKKWLNIRGPKIDDVPIWQRAYGSKRYSLWYLAKKPYPMRSNFVTDGLLFWFNYMKKPIVGLNSWEARTKRLIGLFSELKKSGGLKSRSLFRSFVNTKLVSSFGRLTKSLFLHGRWSTFSLYFGLGEVVVQTTVYCALRRLHGLFSLGFIVWRQLKNMSFKETDLRGWLEAWRLVGFGLSWFFKQQDIFKKKYTVENFTDLVKTRRINPKPRSKTKIFFKHQVKKSLIFKKDSKKI